MRRRRLPAPLLALLLALPAFAADDTHLSSLPLDPLTAAEAKRLYSIGSPNIRAVPVWLLLDGTGLGTAAVARLEAATGTTPLPASHSQLVHLVVALRDNSAGGWRRAVDGSPRWVIHVAVEETLFAKLKGHARVGSQRARLKIAGPWSSYRVKTYCAGTLGAAACGSGKPAPFVLLGVTP